MFSYIYFSKLRYVLHKELLFFKKCLHTCTSALKLFYTKSLHLPSILHKRVILINTFLIDEPFYLTLSRVLIYKLFYNKKSTWIYETCHIDAFLLEKSTH